MQTDIFFGILALLMFCLFFTPIVMEAYDKWRN